MHIIHVYMQCSLRVDGSILPGVFILLCVVPESSHCSMQRSNLQPIGSLVLKLLYCRYNSTESTVASFKKEAATKTAGFSPPVQFRWTTIGFTEKLSADLIPRARIHVVLSHKTPLQQQFYRVAIV